MLVSINLIVKNEKGVEVVVVGLVDLYTPVYSSLLLKLMKLVSLLMHQDVSLFVQYIYKYRNCGHQIQLNIAVKN